MYAMRIYSRLRNTALLRPILYRLITRLSIAAALALSWNRFVNHNGLLSVYDYALPVFSAVFFMFAWFGYLRISGLFSLHPKKQPLKKMPKRKASDISDFVDEKVSAADLTEPDDTVLCSFAANVLCGVLLLLPATVRMLIR